MEFSKVDPPDAGEGENGGPAEGEAGEVRPASSASPIPESVLARGATRVVGIALGVSLLLTVGAVVATALHGFTRDFLQASLWTISVSVFFAAIRLYLTVQTQIRAPLGEFIGTMMVGSSLWVLAAGALKTGNPWPEDYHGMAVIFLALCMLAAFAGSAWAWSHLQKAGIERPADRLALLGKGWFLASGALGGVNLICMAFAWAVGAKFHGTDWLWLMGSAALVPLMFPGLRADRNFRRAARNRRPADGARTRYNGRVDIEAVRQSQDRLLGIFNRLAVFPFVLSGGTALSRFYFRRRPSEDLDFFSGAGPLDFAEAAQVALAAQKEGLPSEEIGRTDRKGFLRVVSYVMGKDPPVRVDFIEDPFAGMWPPEARPSDTGLVFRVDALDQIYYRKVFAWIEQVRRTSHGPRAKDLADGYALDTRHKTLENALQEWRGRGVGMDEGEVARSLDSAEPTEIRTAAELLGLSVTPEELWRWMRAKKKNLLQEGLNGS